MRFSSIGPGASRSLARYSSLLLALLVALAVVFASGRGNGAAAEPGGYSPYADPDKAVLSAVLAGKANLTAFRMRFGLTDDEAAEVLSAVQEERRALAEEYAQSEELLEAEGGLSASEARKKVEASDYDERVRAIIAATKADIEALLPPERRAELAAWADERFFQDARVASDGLFSASGADSTLQASSTGYTCKVWATHYRGYTNYEVALPHKKLKLDGGYRVRIRTMKDTVAWAPVKEVGPWNVRDNYWQRRKYRDMWDDLPRCTPEAHAAYYRDYNNGKDQFGRTVLNPAGFDITIAVAKKLHIARQIRRNGKVRVYVYYPWVR